MHGGKPVIGAGWCWANKFESERAQWGGSSGKNSFWGLHHMQSRGPGKGESGSMHILTKEG